MTKPTHSVSAAYRAAEVAARESYGRLVAYLAATSRDLAAAEDALTQAFQRALEVWPVRGVPDNPPAWLLVTARRELLHHHRHSGVRRAAEPTLQRLAEKEDEALSAAIPDERLRLLFVCAHPAIDPAAQTPLMLQTVLGLDAARIAAAFVVPAATMSQRLVRAKAKIRDAGIAFELPDSEDIEPRLAAVLAGVYGAFATGWDDVVGGAEGRHGLAEEAIWLGRVLVSLLPGDPEVRGLLALMLHCQSRSAARRSPDNEFVPLVDQDPQLWDRAMIVEAEQHLGIASRAGKPGRYQLEAAIQSAHAQRGVTGSTPWHGIDLLYEGLAALSPTVGTLVGRSVVRARTQSAEAGLALLDAIPAGDIQGYQPYWVSRATILNELGRFDDRDSALERALDLTDDPAVRAFLVRGPMRLR